VASPTIALVLRFMRIQSYIYRTRAAAGLGGSCGLGELAMCGLSPRPAVPGGFRCDPHSISSTIQIGTLEYIPGSIFDNTFIPLRSGDSSGDYCDMRIRLSDLLTFF
jgi:hypothetical protein